MPTNIQWTDETINFWTGCTKVSPGCKFCYMYRDKERWNKDGSELLLVDRKTILKKLRDLEALRLKRLAEGNTDPLRIFTCSWSDFFIDGADDWRAEAWQIIQDHSQFIWQVLTKRSERIKHCSPEWALQANSHVHFGVSVESQDYVYRIEHLDGIAAITFASMEPLLGPVNLITKSDKAGALNRLPISFLDWVIVGGESGNNVGKYLFRDCQEDWIQGIVNTCAAYGVPVFVKQMGTAIAQRHKLKHRHGGDMEEWPADRLKVRQLP